MTYPLGATTQVVAAPPQTQCLPGQYRTCVGSSCSCSDTMPDGMKAALAIAGVLVVGLISLGFYQAYKGIRPIYHDRHGMNVYL